MPWRLYMVSLRYHPKMSIRRVSKTSTAQARQIHPAALLMIHMSKWTFQIHTSPPEQMPQTSRPSQLSHLQEVRRHNVCESKINSSVCYYQCLAPSPPKLRWPTNENNFELVWRSLWRSSLRRILSQPAKGLNVEKFCSHTDPGLHPTPPCLLVFNFLDQ